MLPALSLHLGEPGSSAQATSGPAHDALVTLTDGGIPSGVLTPAEVLTSAGSRATGAVAAQAAHVPGVYAAVAPATPDYRRERHGDRHRASLGREQRACGADDRQPGWSTRCLGSRT